MYAELYVSHLNRGRSSGRLERLFVNLLESCQSRHIPDSVVPTKSSTSADYEGFSRRNKLSAVGKYRLPQ